MSSIGAFATYMQLPAPTHACTQVHVTSVCNPPICDPQNRCTHSCLAAVAQSNTHTYGFFASQSAAGRLQVLEASGCLSDGTQECCCNMQALHCCHATVCAQDLSFLGTRRGGGAANTALCNSQIHTNGKRGLHVHTREYTSKPEHPKCRGAGPTAPPGAAPAPQPAPPSTFDSLSWV